MSIDEKMKEFWAQKHTKRDLHFLSGSGHRTIPYLGIDALFNQAKTLLNIGVGTGNFEKLCKSYGIIVDSVDISPTAGEYIRGIVNNFYLTVKDIEPNKYDLITELFVVQHITNREVKLHIKHAIMGLKPDGVYAFNSPRTGIRAYKTVHLQKGHVFRPYDWIENIVSRCGGKCEKIHPKHHWIIYHVKRA